MTTISDALNLFYPAANAAYGNRRDTAPMLIGNDFTLTSQIKVDTAKALKIPIQHQPLLTSMLKIGPMFGYIAAKPGAVMVGFRGTEAVGEWLCDFEAIPLSCKTEGGTIHQGFENIYSVIQESAIEGLKEIIHPDDQVYITGHSLGAALAMLFANDAALAIPNSIQVCTFGGPRVGLMDFVTSYNKRAPLTMRVVNRWDIVPNLPVPFPPYCMYAHAGEVLAIDGGFTLDISHGHSLQLSYLAGLKK